MTKDITGQRFGRLVAVRLGTKKDAGQYFWECKCDCGKICLIRGGQLRSGKTRSCSCLRKDNNLRHGFGSLARSKDLRFYKIWTGIKKRCFSKNSTSYPRYGGMGISMCDEWLAFEAFQRDMYASYRLHCKRHGAKNTTIERRDSAEDYTPDNCRWATYKRQARNLKSNRVVEFRGEKRCVTEWAEMLKIGPSMIYSRLNKGWSAERALTTPRLK